MASGDSLSVAAGDYEESVVILSEDIAIHFEAGAIVNCPSAANASGTWLSIYSTVAMTGELTLKDGGIAVLSSAASFNQSGKIDITIVACSGAVHCMRLGAGVWIQGGEFLCNANGCSIGTCVQLAANTQWQQNGQATITAQTQSPDFSTSSGVKLEAGSVWLQNGSLDLNLINSHGISGSGAWYQTGDVSVESYGAGKKAVQIENLWQQDGTLHLITQMGVGVELAINSATWQQNGPANFEVSAGWQGQDLLPATGITLGIAPAWNQVGSLYLYVAGPGSQGLYCDPDLNAGWTSDGPVEVNATNSAVRGPCKPMNGINSSPSPSITPTPSPTPSVTPSVTPTPSPTPSITPTPSVTLSPTPSPTATSTPTPSATASTTRSPSPTASMTATPSPTWSPLTSPSPMPSVSPSSSPVYLVSNTTQVAVVPVLLFNLTAPDVVLVPKDNEGRARSDAAVGTSIAFIHELSANGSIVRSGFPSNGSWAQVEDDQFNSTSSFLFKADLLTDDLDAGVVTGRANESSAPPQPRVELQFFLFENASTVSVGAVSYDALPAFAKFTVRLTDWVWQSPDDPNERAEVRVAITPAFTGFSEVAGDEADFVREFALTGQQTTYSGRASTRVRLVEAVELDGKLVTAKEAGGNGRKAVEFTLDANSSSLVVSFARFHTSAVYDPDLGVLLTGRSGDGGGGGSSDNTGLIIGVAVAVPLAVLLVLVVIVSAVAITYWRKKQQVNIAAEAAINFNPDDGL